MPAPAVIPALVVYVEVAAVKELVVGFRNAKIKVRLNGVARFLLPFMEILPFFLYGIKVSFFLFYFEKIRALKAGVMLL